MDKKKTLILSILGVIVLVVAVVGISYAMYTFTGTGSKENVITSGTISVSYREANVITLNNVYPSTDALGSATGEVLEFAVIGDLNGSTTAINYEVQFVDVVYSEATGALKPENVNFNITKAEGSNSATYLLGTTANTGIALSTVAATNGTIITSGGYVVASGSFLTSRTDSYVVKAWVNSSYDLPGGEIQDVTDAQGIHHNSETTESTLSFKVKVQAAG